MPPSCKNWKGAVIAHTLGDSHCAMQLGEGPILPSSTVTANIMMLVKFIAHKQFRLTEKRKECLQTEGQRATAKRQDL